MTQLKFRIIPKKAPTLMETLVQIQERMATLDEQIEDHEDRIRTMERMVQ